MDQNTCHLQWNALLLRTFPPIAQAAIVDTPVHSLIGGGIFEP